MFGGFLRVAYGRPWVRDWRNGEWREMIHVVPGHRVRVNPDTPTGYESYDPATGVTDEQPRYDVGTGLDSDGQPPSVEVE